MTARLGEANLRSAQVKALSAGRDHKRKVMEESGIKVTKNPAEMSKLLESVLK
jgi:hypothetical protein